jgi:hypothetical protein
MKYLSVVLNVVKDLISSFAKEERETWKGAWVGSGSR